MSGQRAWLCDIRDTRVDESRREDIQKGRERGFERIRVRRKKCVEIKI